ncbi:gluconate 5-dehydrogenase [Acidocella aquatica]|uniref:Gluconate 5-dehydrogenase n=1 Tax=Acidocella aquatica TaxID=1922313 RepID=A0ABQ6A9F4_9PROT|nr:SDR family oxidoreductase [Acidocella aquatica]GLR68372.1 gluconate 5-dehydrogenase [Acidocella aquatica]
MTMKNLFSVSGKVALVTGGTSGIGLMIAQGLVENGAITYIAGRNGSACQEVAASLSANGTCHGLQGDISTNEGIQALLHTLGERETHLDILVNNAGAMSEAPIDSFSETDWDSVVDLNLKSAFFMVQAALPLLRKAAAKGPHASVINTGSIGGRRVGPKENYAYAAAKAGLHHMTGSLAKRLGPENITVNAIAPGIFPSRMTVLSEEMLKMVIGMIPVRRVGEPEDVAGSVIYLASRAGGFTNGAVLPMDGGSSL